MPFGPVKSFVTSCSFPFLHCENAAERQFLARVVEKLWQSERRIGEVKCAIAAIHKIVRAVQPFAFKFVRKDGELATGLDTYNPMVSVLIDCQPSLWIECQSV